MDDHRILSLVIKTAFTLSSQVRTSLEEVGISLSECTIKKWKAKLQEPVQFWGEKNFVDKINLPLNDGNRIVWRRRETARELKHIVCQTWWRQYYGMDM